MASLTLNQVINRIQSLALGHKQVKSFYYYNIVDTLTQNKGVLYPAVFLDHAKTMVSRNEKESIYTFSFYVCDLLNISQDAIQNYNDVESDLNSIAQDIFAMIHSELFQDWSPSMDISIEYLEEEFEDLVGAIKFDIDIATIFTTDRCSVPSNIPLLFTEQNPT